MKWYTLKEKETPKNKYGGGAAFLIRINHHCFEEGVPYYYVVYKDVSYDPPKFIEALGEQYSSFSEDEIEAWTSFEELNKDYERNCIMEENYIG